VNLHAGELAMGPSRSDQIGRADAVVEVPVCVAPYRGDQLQRGSRSEDAFLEDPCAGSIQDAPEGGEEVFRLLLQANIAGWRGGNEQLCGLIGLGQPRLHVRTILHCVSLRSHHAAGGETDLRSPFTFKPAAASSGRGKTRQNLP